MTTDEIRKRIERFERTIATCLCAVPLLFSVQCALVAVSAPIFGAMFADFGAALPLPTRFILNTWRLWAAFGIIVPLGSFALARRGSPNLSVIISTILGVATFLSRSLSRALYCCQFFILGQCRVACKMKTEPNKAVEPTPVAVTNRASPPFGRARFVPATSVAHL